MAIWDALRWICVASLVIGLAAPAACGDAPKRGDVVFESGFEGAEPLAGWSGPATVVAESDGGRSALLERKTASEPSAMIIRALPAEAVRGCVISCAGRVRAENVSAKPQPWNGVKFMLPIAAASGRQWPQARIEVGTFDWKPVRFAVRVPADATEVTLCLGLEAVTGKVWFDDVKITVARPPVAARPKPAPVRHKGHDLPRLRGAMVSPRTLRESDLATLGGEWKANLVRWQLIRSARPGTSVSLDEWDRWLDEELKRLDAMLPTLEKYGLYVALDLHSPPGGQGTAGGYAGSDGGLFADKACQDRFVSAWERMARRYKGSKVIWGFDLANEPVEDSWTGEVDDWHALAERTARAIRAIDPNRTLIVEPAEWGGPDGLRHFVPVDVPNVVYSVHMYIPHEFTHQGVHSPSGPIRYPGTIGGKQWDKAALRAALEPAVQFQKAYNVHMYIGEFSAIRWAPDGSAYRYLRDLIEVMEELGWDWSYHAFREWDGWSVEHGEDRANRERSASRTDRERLLRDWFAKNKKPQWARG